MPITGKIRLILQGGNRLDRSADGGTIANCPKKGIDFRQAAAQW
jgi:hypothetical protein